MLVPTRSAVISFVLQANNHAALVIRGTAFFVLRGPIFGSALSAQINGCGYAHGTSAELRASLNSCRFFLNPHRKTKRLVGL